MSTDTRALVVQCRDALAEEMAAWDIDPPLHHVKEAHDACVAWLANPPVNQCGETCERAKLCATCARGLEEQSPVAWRTCEPMREHWALTDDAYLASCRRAFGHTVIPLYAASAPSPIEVTATQAVDPLP